MMSRKLVFITGMQRAGTTLVEKLLSMHPDAHVLSQPFPLLFVELKRKFLTKIGYPDETYPLGNLFRESRYRPEDFASYLDEWHPDPGLLWELFSQMKGYSGQYTRFDDDLIRSAIDGAPGWRGFAETMAGLCDRLIGSAEPPVYGSKETLCEEYVPNLLDNGAHCVLVLRDPRDVLASLNFSKGATHAGRRKPTLFNIRNWRKSAAIAIHFESHPRLQWIRYEDLVLNPLDCLNRLAGFLDLSPLPQNTLEKGLRDQSGKQWEGNSTFGTKKGVNSESVGNYERVLPPGIISFCSAACYPELSCLGYNPGIQRAEVLDLLEKFQDPQELERPELEEFLSKEQASLERERFERLLTLQQSEEWFLYQDVASKLRSACRM